MATPQAVFHAYLRPATLQILRATGYHTTRPNVVDSLTDLAARYLAVLCEKTAAHATHNHADSTSADFDVSDIRLALQDIGALLPDKIGVEDRLAAGDETEDVRGVEDFIAWFNGQRMKELMDVGTENGESDATDYLNALKKKHNKTGDDAKYNGTILGRPTQGLEIAVEGGPVASINEWISQRRNDSLVQDVIGSPASSALTSVGDQLRDEDGDMDMT